MCVCVGGGGGGGGAYVGEGEGVCKFRIYFTAVRIVFQNIFIAGS